MCDFLMLSSYVRLMIGFAAKKSLVLLILRPRKNADCECSYRVYSYKHLSDLKCGADRKHCKRDITAWLPSGKSEDAIFPIFEVCKFMQE